LKKRAEAKTRPPRTTDKKCKAVRKIKRKFLGGVQSQKNSKNWGRRSLFKKKKMSWNGGQDRKSWEQKKRK